jgi:hypothetical protein
MRFATSFFLILFVAATSGFSQFSRPDDASPRFKKQTLTLAFGTGIPHPRSGLISFWDMDLSGSARFMVSVSKPIAFGFGVDAALLKFSESSFRSAYPTVPLQSKNMALANVYIAMKWSMMPSMRFCPYVGIALGATHVSEAIYGDIIDSVRVSYYNIPQHTRLTLGFELGTDIYITHWLAFDLEAKTNYVHNDPYLGAASFVRGGFRFTL